jgi:RecJ-like exonuclease
MVEGNRVLSVVIEGELLAVDEGMNFKCMTCRDTNEVRVFNQCDHCDGVGCPKCDAGLVQASIPCPVCEQNRKMSSRY